MDIKLILSIWGASLSTILALLTFIKFQRDSKVNLLMISTVEEPFESLRIEICNKNNKPASLKSLEVGIGPTRSCQTILVEKKLDNLIKLQESEVYIQSLEKSEIQKGIRNKNIVQKQFQRLHITLSITTGQKFHDLVYIDPKLIEGEYYENAEQFIATDLFVGFSTAESTFHPIGTTK